MTNETRATISVPNDILARNSTTCNGRINITPVVGTSNAFPINVSPECTVGKDCTILVGDRSGGTTEYSGFFTLSNGTIYVQTSSDVLETFRNSDKTFSTFEMKRDQWLHASTWC